MNNTNDLISRERALEALQEANVRVSGLRLGKTIMAKYTEQVREGYIDIIRKVPAEEAEMLRIGQWISLGKTEKGSSIRKCSYCGVTKAGRPASKFCPDCGAMMLLNVNELDDILREYTDETMGKEN